jgi:hypothetical protein
MIVTCILAVAALAGDPRSTAPSGSAGATIVCPPGTEWSTKSLPRGREEWCRSAAGPPHGPAVVWYGSGIKRQAGRYRNGQAHGRWTYWYENGAPRSRGTWRDGTAHGRWTYWHPHARKESEGRFRDGRRHGRWRYWYEDGHERTEGRWRDGEKAGLWTELSPDGSVVTSIRHRPGAAAATSVRITMDALHRLGGTPPRWLFTPPSGDPAAGRVAFVRYGCHACHAVMGEDFGEDGGTGERIGPDLSGMGSHHPPGYLAESIVNPDAVLLEGAGYLGPDGRSRMPAYPEMSLGELTDLVAYLAGLTGGACHE